jgi:hypothetical protein
MAVHAVKNVYQSPVDDAGDPHGGVGGGVRTEHRGGRQPPGQAPPRQEEVRLRATGQAIEKERAPHHQQEEGAGPDPVQKREVGQGTVVSEDGRLDDGRRDCSRLSPARQRLSGGPRSLSHDDMQHVIVLPIGITILRQQQVAPPEREGLEFSGGECGLSSALPGAPPTMRFGHRQGGAQRRAIAVSGPDGAPDLRPGTRRSLSSVFRRVPGRSPFPSGARHRGCSFGQVGGRPTTLVRSSQQHHPLGLDRRVRLQPDLVHAARHTHPGLVATVP